MEKLEDRPMSPDLLKTAPNPFFRFGEGIFQSLNQSNQLKWEKKQYIFLKVHLIKFKVCCIKKIFLYIEMHLSS